MSADFALPLAQSGLCDMCVMFVATDEFNGCCSETCLNELYRYLHDLDAEHITDHLTLWSEL